MGYNMKTQLSEFSVKKLFGLYDHEINFKIKDHVTAVIGPNGLGKTACLKIIEAIFNRNYLYFYQIDFESVQLKFTTKEVIKIVKKKTNNKRDELDLPFKDYTVTYTSSRGSVYNYTPIDPGTINKFVSIIDRRNPYTEEIDDGVYFDNKEGDILNPYGVVNRYGHLLSNVYKRPKGSEEHKNYINFLNKFSCHLIEAQRLFSFSHDEDEDEGWSPTRRRKKIKTHLAVQTKAKTISKIINAELAKYAILSQSKDRTFPMRVIRDYNKRGKSIDIKEKLTKLDEKRQNLVNSGILDSKEEQVNFDGRSIDDSLFPVLKTYILDNEEKLQVFDSLLSKISLFIALVNERFLDKKIGVDKNKGFIVTNKVDAVVPLDKLSSGEQHQLVIVFDLLFGVTGNSIILIDEPELSMHLVWQKVFIDSLKKIINLNPMDIVLATHSPFLVSAHEELVSELNSDGE